MAQAPDVGSHVRLKLTTHDGDTTIEGVVLPPALAEHVTVKLANGYNISHHISSIEILSAEQPVSTDSIESDAPSMNPDLPRSELSTPVEPLLRRLTTQQAL